MAGYRRLDGHGLARAGRRDGAGPPRLPRLSPPQVPAAGRAAAHVVGVEGLALLVGHLVEQDVRALHRRHPAQVVQRPHLLLVAQVQVRLRHHGLAVVADVAHVRHHVCPVPAVVERLPLTVPDELAHVRGGAALVGRPERDRIGPPALLVAVGAPLAVDLVDDHVLAYQAGDHAGPAAVRVLVVDVLGDDRVVPVRPGQPVVVLPPLAVPVVPAGVLVLEPLEVFVGHRVDPPVVGQPARGEELRDLVDVALVPDLVPRLLDEVVRDDQAVLLQRHQVAAVVVVVDPPPPHLGVGLAVLAPVLGAVLDERADGRVHHTVVVPPGVAQVTLEKLMVALVGERHQQRRVAVADVPRLVGLHRVEHGRQQVVAVRRGLGRHGHEQRVREGRLGHDGQVDARRGDGVTGDEALGELAADRPAVVVLEVAEAGVEAGRVDVVVHVQALEVLLDRRVPYLVDHLDRLAVVQLRVRDRAEQQRHGPRRGDLGQRDDGQEQLLPFQPALLHLAEHVAADGTVLGAVDAVVLLLLHREVRPEHLLQRVLLLGLLEGVVRPVLGHWLVVQRFPGQLLNLLVCLSHALATHLSPLALPRVDVRLRGLPVGTRAGTGRSVRVRQPETSHRGNDNPRT